MDDDEIEVTEEILSFHSNVRENIVSWNLHLKIAVKLSETKMKSERNNFLMNCKWAASFALSGFKNVGQIEERNICDISRMHSLKSLNIYRLDHVMFTSTSAISFKFRDKLRQFISNSWTIQRFRIKEIRRRSQITLRGFATN